MINIKNDIESGSSSTVRLSIWQDTFNQFLSKPIFGNSLESENIHFHPHNVLLEVLITTGIIGFIPFTLLLFYAFKFSVLILKKTPKYSWLPALFIQSFMQNMFSGGLYFASWLFSSMALIYLFKIQIINHLNKE